VTNKALRRRVAAAARSYMDGSLTWEAFMMEFSEAEDPQISELVDLIEHEPQRDGLLGVSEKDFDKYREATDRLIQKLEID